MGYRFLFLFLFFYINLFDNPFPDLVWLKIRPAMMLTISPELLVGLTRFYGNSLQIKIVNLLFLGLS